MLKFQSYLQSLYKHYTNRAKNIVNLGSLISKTGILLKNNEWVNDKVIDLSIMPQDNICITNSSDGSNFSTNIKSLDNDTLLYGSIRPYFKKCGFTIDHKYVAGTIHTFKPNNHKLLTYILATISSNEFHNFTNANSQGTKMPIINWDTFINFNVKMLNENEIKSFNDKSFPLYEYTKNIMKSNLKLKLLKQTLLNKYFD